MVTKIQILVNVQNMKLWLSENVVYKVTVSTIMMQFVHKSKEIFRADMSLNNVYIIKCMLL